MGYEYDRTYFKNIDTEDKAYFLGFMMADGQVSDRGRGTCLRLVVNLHPKDRDILEKFREAILGPEELVKDRSIIDNRNGKDYGRTYISLNCTDLCRDLASLGIVPRKTGLEYIPELDSNLIRHFVRGYFDGDGCITSAIINKNSGWTKYKVTVSSASKIIIDQMLAVFKTLGCEKPYIINRNTCFVLEYHRRREVYDILHYLYDDCKTYMNRKFDLAQEVLRIISPNLEDKDE